MSKEQQFTKEAVDIDSLATFFRIISDETRLRILVLLYYRELCVCEICDILKISQPKVSRHLARLRDSGYVKIFKDRQWVFYQLNKDKEQGINQLVKGVIEEIIPDNHNEYFCEDLVLDINNLHEKEKSDSLCERKESK